jgi:hypothetical protein
MQNIARQWLQADRAAAEKWIAGLNLAEDKKKNLLNLK